TKRRGRGFPVMRCSALPDKGWSSGNRGAPVTGLSGRFGEIFGGKAPRGRVFPVMRYSALPDKGCSSGNRGSPVMALTGSFGEILGGKTTWGRSCSRRV